ncbi:hypothetical protein AB205_0163340, partial [Aquarana catesbeiana]
ITIQKDPVFSLENLYFKTQSERYEGAVRNIFHLKKKVKELGWEDNGREMDYALRLKRFLASTEHIPVDHTRNSLFTGLTLSGEYSLNIHGVFIRSLTALGTDQQIAKWLPLANNYQILGTYAQTELGHGTYLRGLETTATFDPTTQEFIIDTPTITATKWWPGECKYTLYTVLLLVVYLPACLCSLPIALKNSWMQLQAPPHSRYSGSPEPHYSNKHRKQSSSSFRSSSQGQLDVGPAQRQPFQENWCALPVLEKLREIMLLKLGR